MNDEMERDDAQEGKQEFVRTSGHQDEAFEDRKKRMKKVSDENASTSSHGSSDNNRCRDLSR